MPPAMRNPERVPPAPVPPMPKPPVPVLKKATPKKPLFQSDLPVEQEAYEATAKVLGYEPIFHPYIDENYKAVCAKYRDAKQALEELSKE